MEKKCELVAAIEELRAATVAIVEAVDKLYSQYFSESKLAEEKEVKPVPVITREDVRAVLAEKSSQGYTGQVRELLRAHGADKLSAIDPSEYAALIKEAEVIGNA